MYIIAEIGINHNGDLDTALNMIKIAKELGANCVKFQKRNPDICVPEEQKNKPKTFLGEEMTYLEYKKKLEFSRSDYNLINAFCKEIGISWTASVWDIDSVNFMLWYKNDIPFIKIPSALITDIEFLKAVDQTGIPILMSNGMSTQDQVNEAIANLTHLSGIMHCNSSYPADAFELDLNVIKTYKTMYPGITIGYSGHEEGYFPTCLAAAAGAQIIERHFTLDNEMEGTDQKASLNPDSFGVMCHDLNNIEKIMGSYLPVVYPSEQEVAKKLRKE